MAAVWPVGLPQRMRTEGYNETPPSSAIVTPMETGPKKRRNRFTAAVRPIKGTIRVSFAQRQILDDFFVTTLMGGTLPFDWVHPVTQAPATFVFARPPEYSAFNRQRLTVRLELDQQP